jgi:hypothetical protein
MGSHKLTGILLNKIQPKAYEYLRLKLSKKEFKPGPTSESIC